MVVISGFKSLERSSTQFRAATGALVPSRGLARVGVYTEDGVYHEMRLEVTDIHKFLLSVSALIEADHEVHFTKSRSWIKLVTGDELDMQHENGIFTLRLYEADPWPVFSGQV